nr:SDR family NAD(P)-dependent oxidoreductase [Dongshaea marina]
MKTLNYQNVAVITGAGRGLGESISKELADSGYHVAITDIDLERAKKLSHRINKDGGSSIAIRLDVTDKSGFESALKLVAERFGGVGVLVNNAARTSTTPIFDISPDEFLDVSSTNLLSVFLGSQVFGSYFKDNNYGRIINISSLAGQNGGSATGAHYAASKGGSLL